MKNSFWDYPILVTLLLVSFSAVATIPHPALVLVRHVNVVQELKNRFLNDIRKLQPALKRALRTQTLSYIKAAYESSQPSWYSKSVNIPTQTIDDAQRRYKEIYDQMIEREQEFGTEYYVFYHGQQNNFRVVQDFLKELYSFIHIHSSLTEFEFLRPWLEAEPTLNLNAFIDSHEERLKKGHAYYFYGSSDLEWNDHEPDLVKNMLSVNLSVFGNLTNSGESSYHYFRTNTNVNPPWIHGILNKIFAAYGFNRRYIDELIDLSTLIYTPDGSFLQIFVPKDTVDNYAYLAQAWGTPVRDTIISTIYDPVKKRHMKISALLEKYIDNPTSMGNFDQLQARILLSQEGLLNPESGIKIFRYTTVAKKEWILYQQKIKELTQKIIQEALEQNSFSHMQTTPLMRLMNYKNKTA